MKNEEILRIEKRIEELNLELSKTDNFFYERAIMREIHDEETKLEDAKKRIKKESSNSNFNKIKCFIKRLA